LRHSASTFARRSQSISRQILPEAGDTEKTPVPAEPSIPAISHESFAALYSAAHLPLLRFVLTLLPDRHLAEDVVQETARLLWRKFNDYDPERAFLPWARQFAHFEVLKARRRLATGDRYFSDDMIEQMAHECVEQEDQLERQREALAGCVEKLDAGSRALLASRYDRKESLQEIAEAQGKTPNALYLTLRRARQALLECVNRALHLEGWS
jgi:RNA polymerase sigma-70 factor, ECF subfamily